MRLIMSYDEGNGYTYSCHHALPLEYESAEAALVDFERILNEADASHEYEFKFVGHEFSTDTFREDSESREAGKFFLPDFLTVDEWFEQNLPWSG